MAGNDFITGWIESLRTGFLRMPYKSENQMIAMYVFLPEFKPTSIDDLLMKLTSELLDDIFNGVYFSQHDVDVNVKFPKFAFEKKADLIPVC